MTTNISIPAGLFFDTNLTGAIGDQELQRLDSAVEKKLRAVRGYPDLPDYKGRSLNISKSLLSEFWKVLDGESCQRYFYEVYIAKSVQTQTSKPMMLGNWFEHAAGCGSVPDEELTKEVGLMLKGGSAGTDLARAIDRGKAARKWLDEQFPQPAWRMNTQVKLQWNQLKAIADVELSNGREKIILDLKYSGKVGDGLGWDRSGSSWDIQEDSRSFFASNPLLMVQPLLTTLIMRKLYRRKSRFIFLIGCSSPADAYENDFLYPLEVKIGTDTMHAFENDLLKYTKRLKRFLNRKEFLLTRPHITRCNACQVKDCLSRATERKLSDYTVTWSNPVTKKLVS